MSVVVFITFYKYDYKIWKKIQLILYNSLLGMYVDVV